MTCVPCFWQVIVTFHGSGAPGSAHTTILNEVGIARGVLLQALPIAGVLAVVSLGLRVLNYNDFPVVITLTVTGYHSGLKNYGIL